MKIWEIYDYFWLHDHQPIPTPHDQTLSFANPLPLGYYIILNICTKNELVVFLKRFHSLSSSQGSQLYYSIAKFYNSIQFKQPIEKVCHQFHDKDIITSGSKHFTGSSCKSFADANAHSTWVLVFSCRINNSTLGII